jgi:predicted GNAT family N-acyltransferase
MPSNSLRDIEIRRPKSDDDLIALRAMRRQELLGEIPTPKSQLHVDPKDLIDGAITLAAYSPDNTIVSTVRLMPIKDDDSVYEINRMVTAQPYRGRGIGSKVLAEGEQLAKDQGAKAFVLDSRRDARAFYAKAGYWPTGRTQTLENGDINFIMVKQIGGSLK